MSSVAKIQDALPDEQAKLFFRLVNTFGLREDDDRLVVIAAVAMLLTKVETLVTRFESVADAIGHSPEQVRTAIAGGLANLDQAIAEGIEKNIAVTLDMMTNEIRSLVRELVVTETTTAATVRSQAIRDEVAKLTQAAKELALAESGAGAGAERTALTTAAVPAWHKLLWGGAGFFVAMVFVLIVTHWRR